MRNAIAGYKSTEQIKVFYKFKGCVDKGLNKNLYKIVTDKSNQDTVLDYKVREHRSTCHNQA